MICIYDGVTDSSGTGSLSKFLKKEQNYTKKKNIEAVVSVRYVLMSMVLFVLFGQPLLSLLHSVRDEQRTSAEI